MARAKLYLDEDITDLLARVLRSAGYDVVSAHEFGMRARSDQDQFLHAASEGRAIVTFNVAHFAAIARWAFENGIEHSGIVVSNQLGIAELIQRTKALLETASEEELRNSFIWLQ